MTEVFNNSTAAINTLTVTCLISDTQVTVANGSLLSAVGNYRLLIDNEIMLATSRTGNVIQVNRAQEGTAAAAHANGTPVDAILSAGALNQLKADIQASLSTAESKTLYVSSTGSDVTGNGSLSNPFATYAHAAGVATTGGAASGNQWTIVYTPGQYSESPLTIRPWIDVMVVDDANLGDTTTTSGAVVLNAGTVNLHSSWTAAGNGVAGFSGLRIMADVLLDFGSISAPNARTVWKRCTVVGTAFFTDSDTFASTTELWGCQIFSNGSGTGFYCSNNGTMKVYDSVINMPASLSNATMYAYGAKFLSGFSFLNEPETLNAYGCTFLGLGVNGHAAAEVETGATATINVFGGYADSVYIDGSSTTSQWTSWGTSVAGNVHLIGTGALYQSDQLGMGTSLTSSGGAPTPVIKGSGSAPAPGYILQSAASGGFTWIVTPSGGGGGASGDNGAALRASHATSLPSGSNGAQIISDLAVTDGAEGLFAGAAIGLTGSHAGGKYGPTKLYFAGTTGGHGEGGLFSFDCGGERIEFLGSLAGPHNPDDLITFSIGNNPDFSAIATVGKGGMDVWEDGFFQGEGFSALQHLAGAEDWTGGRIAYVPNFQNNDWLWWTAPTPGKVYGDSVDGGFFTTALTIAETPKAICKDNQSRIWISFTGSSKVRKYTTTLVDASLTQQGADISNAGTIGVTDMLFDGQSIWTFSGTTGVLAKLSGTDGSFVASVTFPTFSAQSRIIFDGASIWVTAAGPTGSTTADWVRVDPDTLGVVLEDFMDSSSLAIRGMCAIPGSDTLPGGGLYMVGRLSTGTNHLYLGLFHPPQGDFPLYQRKFSRAQTSNTITSFAALNIQTQPGNFTGGTSFAQNVEYTITAMAQASGSPGAFAWFKKRARIQTNGTFITGDPVDVDDSPKLNAGATSDGLGFALTLSGSFLVGTITQTSGGGVFWSFMIEEMNANGQNWY